jgi:hypothetical protein
MKIEHIDNIIYDYSDLTLLHIRKNLETVV